MREYKWEILAVTLALIATVAVAVFARPSCPKGMHLVVVRQYPVFTGKTFVMHTVYGCRRA